MDVDETTTEGEGLAATPTDLGGISPAPAPDGEGAGPYLTPSEENKLYRKLLGFSRKRWPLNEKIITEAIDVMARNLKSDDPRVVNGAVRNLIAMEAQNIKVEEVALTVAAAQERATLAAHQVNVQVNNSTTIQTLEYRELPPRGEEPEPLEAADGEQITYEVPG